MVYRSYTPIATRKSPAFRGKSIHLDGISDFIDFQADDGPDFEQCAFAFRHSNRHSTQNSTNEFYNPASFAMWVKFPSTAIADIVSSYNSSNDLKHFIFKNSGINETSGGNDWIGAGNSQILYWSGCFLGLVGAADGTVRLAGGWGTYGGTNIGKRVIRHGDTAIAADTWYHIAFVLNGKDQNNGMSGNTAYGITLYVNSVAQTLSVYYPQGTVSGELDVPAQVNSAGDYGYYVPASTAEYTWPGNPHSTWRQFSPGYAAGLGKNHNDYMELIIHDFVYWGTTELLQADINDLYNRNNINLVPYNTNYGTYTKGEDTKATVANLNFSGGASTPDNHTIRLTDMNGLGQTFKFLHSNTGLANGYEDSSDNTVIVHYDDGSGGSNINNTECCKNFLNALNSVFSAATSISATFNSGGGDPDFLSFEQGLGGTQGNTAIEYSLDFDTDYVRAGAAGNAPTAFTGGIDRIHGVWKFRGPRTDSTLDSRLNVISNRASEWNQDPLFNYRKHVPGAVSSQYSLDELPMRTMPALIHGGLFIDDIPADII